MKIGIIGLGSMGQMLVNALCKSEAVLPENLIVYNRTRKKAESLQSKYHLEIASSAQEVCDRADLFFICTKPLDILPLLRELSIPATAHVVSVAAGVGIEDLESVHQGPVSKVIPTVTSQELCGVSLFTCSSRLSAEQKQQLITLLASIGVAQEISEGEIETATILTSSAPGLLAGIMESYAQAAVSKTPELSIETARSMLVETMLGTAKLLQAEQLGFDELIERVATKGGITEEGLRVLDKRLPAGFDELFDMTESKHAMLKEMVQKQLIF
jgi:pyrroline-5-carboxylate reductase